MSDQPWTLSPESPELEIAIGSKMNGLTKPVGSLGEIEKLAAQICRIQRTCHPRLQSPVVLIFAADHGIASRGVSAYPQLVTGQMVLNFLTGGAAISVLARQHGLALRVVDAGLVAEPAPHRNLISERIAPGTHDFSLAPAMSPEQMQRAIDTGARIVRSLGHRGTNAFLLGEMGIGNTSSASMLVHVMTGWALEECVGKGTGLDDPGLARKCEILAHARSRCSGPLSPTDALTEFGGFEIAMLVGAMIAAAENQWLVVIDGFIVAAALLIATRLRPDVRSVCVISHVGDEKGHQALLDSLKMDPLLDLHLRLGEASGAAFAWPLIVSSVNLLNEMASFESAGVTGPHG